MDSKELSRDSRERSRSDHSSKSRESSQSGSRSESREKSSKSESRSSKSEYSKSRSDSKHSSSKSDSPDKKSKHDQSLDTDREKSRQNTSPGEPEHKEPIKLKLTLSQTGSKSKIYSAVPTGSTFISSHVTDDSNDSATSFEDYEETRKRTKSRKEGSSKKKKSKDKSKKSKSSSYDPDTLAPPELELMETGESTQISEAEASLLTDPEPLALQEDTMDLSAESLPGGSTPYQDSEEMGSQQMSRICSFCACGERSLLGQGDMARYDPTPGYNAFRKCTLKSSKKPSLEVEERGMDRGPKPLTSRRNRGPMKTASGEMKALRHTGDDQSEGFDELATVGYPEDTDLTAVIESSGHVWAHHCCAAWSEGVLQTEDFMLQYVDKAVVMGLSKKCSYCLRYGATINCRYSRCNKIFHYPCASAGGCFQDIKSLSLLCPDHTDEAQTIAGEEALCVVCNIVGNIHEQLFCTSCGHHYHGNCLHPPVEVNPIVRAGWQCPDCKICQMCRHPGADDKMLVCDMCDKGYHTFCLKPVMTAIPKNGWKCKNCRVCEDCGSRTPGSGRSSRWHLNYTVCDSCYQQRNKGLSCPLCGKAYRHFSQKAMVQCNLCKKLVHSECDDTIDAVLLHQVKNEEPTDYMCTICRNRDPEMDMPDFPIGTIGMGMIEDSSDSQMMQKTGGLPSAEILDEYGEDSQHTSDFLLNEDSLSSIDIDFNLLEKMSPPYTMPSREGEVSHGKGKLVAMMRKNIAAKAKNRQLAPEKRKRPLTFGEKRRAPKPKVNMGPSFGTDQIGGSSLSVNLSKKSSAETDDDEDDHPNTLILARKDDGFVFNQDVCKSCGSYGRGDEGRLIACTQCGQCYHPYCANIKVTKIVVQKGWRCLDCTVCEGCGQPHDEGRLLLCDECDISYHTYCLDPPLDHVPKGTWKCKWCVICLICGSTNPGFGCQWQRNYTHCGPCHSKISCPVCRYKYHEDELIIQCVQCDRWLHAFCDGIHNEDDAERAADFGYHCIICRPRTGQPGPLPPPPLPPSPPSIEKYLPLPLPLPPPPPKEPEPPRFYLVDGVLLSTAGRNQIESIRQEAPKIKRHRRWGKKPEGWDDKRGEIEKKMVELMAERRVSQDTEAAMSAPTISRMLSIGSVDDEEKELEDFKSPDEGGPDGELGQTPPDPQAKQVLEAQAMALVAEEKKMKKKRNISRLGVGGFLVKPRFKPRAKRQQSLMSEGLEGNEGIPGIPQPLEGEEGFPPLPMMDEEKPRKRRQGVGQGRRKSQLQENFPSYMQEAFFGQEILATSKDRPLESLRALDSDEEKSPMESPKSMEVKEESEIAISSEPLLQQISEKQKQIAELPGQSVQQTPVPAEPTANEEEDLDIDIDIDIEDEFINMFGDELLQEEMPSADVSKAKDRQPEADNLDLPHLDEKNIPDIDSMLSEGLAHIDSKTVEDIFKGVWQGQEGQTEAPAHPHPQPPQPPHPIPTQHPQHPQHPAHPPEVNYPVPMASRPHPPDHPLPPHHQYPQFPEPMGGQHPPPFDPNFPTSWPQALTEDTSGQDSSRRNMQKWESDEDLGVNATISPILYCNMNHPELKQQYPEWSERSKQIAKIWRKLTADEKQPFLLKARKNRGTYKTKTQTKVTPEQRRKKAEAAMGQMVFPSPEGPPGMQSPMHPSPGGMPSPMRPGAQMMPPGTPEGQSPSHSLSGMSESPGHPVPLPGFQGPEHPFQKQPSVGDPYSHLPPASRPQDPYSMPPPTPRTPMGEQYPQPAGAQRGPVGDQFGHSPTGRPPSDPYSRPPSTPRSAEHTPPHDQFRSPVKDPYMHSPGVGPAGEHFMQPPSGAPRPPQPGPRPPLQHHPSWPQEMDSYERQQQTPFSAPGTPRPMVPQAGGPPGAAGLRPPHPMGPRFMRQRSEPGTGAAGEDPYAFPPGTSMEGPVHPGGRMSIADAFAVPPGTPQPVRMPERQMSMPAEGQIPPNSMAHFRPPFRPPAPHTTQTMMRLPNVPQDPYSQQPATPRPGMEHPMELHPGLRPPEPSALQQMYAAANRRQIFPPLSRMWSLSLAGAQSDIQKQQLREILAQQTKQNLKKKEQQGSEMYPPGQEGGFTEPRPPGFPGPRMPMPPGSQAPTQPGQEQLSPLMFARGMKPQGELTPEEKKKVLEYFQHKVLEKASILGHVHPGIGRGSPADQMHQQHPGTQGAPPIGVAEAGAQQAEDGQGTSKDGIKRPQGVRPDGRIPKPSVSSEEEKTDDADELGDFLGEDGTFDILKYADPDLDLLGSDNKTIFDDLVDDSDKKEAAGETKELKAEEKPLAEGNDIKAEDGDKQGPVSEFQAKFLEFSQRKQASEKQDAESDLKKQEAGVSHIAAILQNAERAGRPQSVKSEGAEGIDSHTPTTPGTPMTPGQDPNATLTARAQGQFGPGVPSPAQQGMYAGQNSTQPSPAGSGFGQPGSGMPSPKVQPSPKSQPSPRTPGESSIQGQQPSPFSQRSTQSPFSPSANTGQSPYTGTPTSAPQSPFAGMKPQSPFAVPGSSGTQQLPPHMNQGSPLPTSYSPGHTPPTAFPMQRSPRAAVPPGNQYMPGTYPQRPFGPGITPRGTLTPSPTAVSYGKPGMRPQGPPGAAPGIQSPGSVPVSQQQNPGPGQPALPGSEIASPGVRVPMPGMRPQFPPGHPGGTPMSPGHQPLMYPQGMMPGQRPGPPGQQMPPFVDQQHMTRPPTSVPAGPTTIAGQRPALLEDQPLLIQDLLEQEKREQQKRQAEQQAMMHRRDPGVRPEGMVGPRPGMPPPQGMMPRMEGPVRHPGQPGMFIPPEMAAFRPRVPGQLSPRTPGAQPGMMGMQPGPMRMPGPPMQPPPKPPTPGETGPEAEQQHIMYDTWLVRQGEALEGQVKFLEQQIQKQKRTKKAINARNRQAKKSGQEAAPQDAMDLERANQDLAVLQKQLDQCRKQNRQHHMLAQEYRSKQQEHFTMQMAAQGQPPQAAGPQTTGAPMAPVSTPASTPMQPPPPRVPGVQGSVRLTASARQEYEAYVQNRLRMMGPQGMPGGPRIPPPGALPPGQPQPRMAIGDNNPFSEEFQEREQMEKMRETQSKQIPPGGPLEKQDESQEPPVPRPLMPPFADPRFPGQPGPTTQPQRFPVPGQHEQQPWIPARYPFDTPTGQRLPGPTDPRFAGTFPPPGSAGQMPPQAPGPSYPAVAVPEMGHPPSVSQPMESAAVTDTKEKTKKRKKKKKTENAQTPPTSQPPPGKPPPLQFKPHDETERRIMEILNSTVNLQRGQPPGSALPPPTSSAPQTSQSQSPAASTADQNPSQSASDSGQSGETVTSQPVTQGEGHQAVSHVNTLQPSKTPPVQGRLTPGQSPARSPASLSAAKSPASQQGRQTPGSATSPHPVGPPGTAGPPGPIPPPPPQPSPQPQQPESGAPQPPGTQSVTSVPPAAAPPNLHPAPPSLQHAPSTHPPSTSATIAGPPSLQVAPHVRPPMSVPQSVQGPPGIQQGPLHMPPGLAVSHPGLPPGHPHQSHPSFPRHYIPGMVSQRPDQGPPMMQRPGYPPMERMPGLLGRPPMLPHWMAPRQEYPPNAGQSRRSPRLSLPGMNTLARTGLPQLSLRQGVPHLPSGPFSPGSSTSSSPHASGDQPQISATTHTSLEDTSQTTIQAGIPHSSPEVTPVQPAVTGPATNLTMQAESTADTQTPDVSAIQSTAGQEDRIVTTQSDDSSVGQAVTQKTEQEKMCDAEISKISEISIGAEKPGKTDSEVEGVETENVPSAGQNKETKDNSGDSKKEPSSSEECTDGVHCGTPPPKECTDGIHCGTPPPQECSDGIHCGTPPPQECTDGIHCGTPPPQECSDGIHCGTPPPQECTDGIHCGTPPPQECSDGIHCGTPPPQECTDGIRCGTPPPQECSDGIHCGTPPPQKCTDGIHCGTPPPQECTDGMHYGTPTPQESTDDIHCGTPILQECTDGMHCGTPPPKECTDGTHCGTPPPPECTDGMHCGTPPPQECTDGIHCGTPPPQECTDGMHCGTPPPQECTDGIHCGTPPPQKCSDGMHCGTPPPPECTDGIHCGTPPPQACTDGAQCGTLPPLQECRDGIHCGTPPPQEYTDGQHCGTPSPQECTDGAQCGAQPPLQECRDGIHCGTPPPQECTDGRHCGTPPPQECTDGQHCGTPPPQECTDGQHCGTPPPQECTDGQHCGTPPPQECTDGQHCGTPPPQECTDGQHCGTPPPQECTDGQHCGTPPPQDQANNGSQSSQQSSSEQQQLPSSSEHQPPPPSSSVEEPLTVITTHDAPPSLQPAMLSPQQLAVQVDHQYINVKSQPPVLVPSHSDAQETAEKPITDSVTPSHSVATSSEILPAPSANNIPSESQPSAIKTVAQPLIQTSVSSQEQNNTAVHESLVSEPLKRHSPLEPQNDIPNIQTPSTETADVAKPVITKIDQSLPVTHVQSDQQDEVDRKLDMDMSDAVQQKGVPISEAEEEHVTNEQTVSQDEQEKPKPPTPVIEPFAALVPTENSGKLSPVVQPVGGIETAVDQGDSAQKTKTVLPVNEKPHPVLDSSNQVQVTVKPEVESDQVQAGAVTTEVKTDQSQEDVLAQYAKKEVIVSADEIAANGPPVNTSSAITPSPSVTEIVAVSKTTDFSESKTEEQSTHPFTSTQPQLTSVPRPRYFGSVGDPRAIHRHMFPGHMAGTLPYPGPIPGRHPAHPQDIRQQQGQPPFTQATGNPRQPQPAHFHESQLRFMQQMYQHQMARGQRPQAAHQTMQQFQKNQQQYGVPPGFRDPFSSQPGFPPQFYQQHPLSNIAGSRLQHPSSTQEGSVPSHVKVNRSQSASPKEQNLPRLPGLHTVHMEHPRHPTPRLPTDSSVQHQDTFSVSEPAVTLGVPTIPAEGKEITQAVSKPGVIPPAVQQPVIKQEPVDYQQASCPFSSVKTSSNVPLSSAQQQHIQTESKAGPSSAVSSIPSKEMEQRSESDTMQSATVESGSTTVSSLNSTLDSKESITTVTTSVSVGEVKTMQPGTEIPDAKSSDTTASQVATTTTFQVLKPQEQPSAGLVVSNAADDHQHHIASAIPRPHSGSRQSPGHSQGHTPDTSHSSAELTLPSVSATFAAAGMMRYGEGMHPGLPPYSQGHYRHIPPAQLSTHGPGFSSVSSIVQSVSSVSFPSLGGTPAPHHTPNSVPAEVSLPPSTGVSSEAVSSVGASASTQTPVHHKVGPHPQPVPPQPVSSATPTEQEDIKPVLAGPTVPGGKPTRPGHLYPDMQGAPGAPNIPVTPGPRMPVPPHTGAPQTATQSGHVSRPRGPRQSQQHPNHQAGAARFARIPSNLPPHLAGMLNNMRTPMPARPMYQQERHPGMPPMGPLRFPPGSQGMMPMAPGGPGGYRMPVSQDGSQMPMPPGGQMQIPAGAARHPVMMPQGMPMRPGMRIPGPGQQHPMQPPHPSQISPTGHPGAPPPPHMHQRMMHPATSSGPIMGPPGLPQPSGHPSPKEAQSPTQAMPQRPPTPGSMPSTPSPTSFPHGMMPVTSGVPSTAPGFLGEMHLRERFPRQGMMPRPHFDGRTPFDGRMPFDPSMNMIPRPGMEGVPRQPGYPPGLQRPPGVPPNIPGQQETPQSPSGSLDEAMKRMGGGKPGPSPTPPHSGLKSATPPAGSETTSASTTPPSPMVNIKQEQNLDPQFGLDPSQNALLKRLLAKSNAAAAAAAISGKSTPQSTDQSEDSNDFSNIQLTPEQQRQLELIEKMPLLKETQPNEATFKTGELGEPDLEAKRLEFERRRKEMEEVRKLKRTKGDGVPRKRKKKNQMEGQLPGQMPGQFPGQGQPPGFDPTALVMGEKGQQIDMGGSPEKTVKKRMRKSKKDKVIVEEGNFDGAFDLFMQQLKQLQPVPLMEPLVSHMYAICSLPGMSSTTNAENQMQGVFGKVKLESDKDFYGESGTSLTPSVGLSKPQNIAERRKLISDKADISDQQRYLMMMDSIRNEGQGSTSPFGLGSQLLGMPKGAAPTLPPPPRVEPRVNVPKGVTDSPDSMISSSSPEMGFGESAELPDYPMLRPIEPAVSDEETRTSPAVPLLQPVPVKIPQFMVKPEKPPSVEKKPEIKPPDVPIPAQKGKEELDSALSALAGKDTARAGEIDPLTGLIRGAKDPKSDQEVSVTLTLSAKAAEDIGGVLSAIADLLKIAAPPSYEVSRSPSPVQQRVVEKHREESLNVHSLARSKHYHMFCRHCDTVILHAGIQKKKSDIPFLTKEEQESPEDYMRFCSMSCFTNFSTTRQITQRLDPKDLPPMEPKGPLAVALAKESHIFSPREITPTSSGHVTPAMTPSSVGTEPMFPGDITPTKSEPVTPKLSSPTMMRQSSLEKLGKRVKASLAEPPKPPVKKWKGIRYKKFEPTLFPEASLIQKKEEDESQQWKKLTQAITYLDMDSEERPKDFRMCEFCKELGDGPSDGTGRLLNMDIDKWTHLNCALWSYEVYETLNGALMNVQQAYKRGLKQKCVVCVNMGATLTCFKQKCSNIYHVECARLVGCVFFEDKTILCPPHGKVPMEQVLKSLIVYRRVYINRDEDSQVANMLLQEDGNFTLRLGSIILNNIGQLLPHQIGSGKFNTRDHMYPVGYKATRFYWSMRVLYRRCRYICSIHDKEGRPEFQVKVVEEGQDDMTLSSNSCKGVWKTILEPVEKMHKEADMVKVFPNFTSGEEFYGLNDPNIVRLIESLPGTDLLKDYIFKFGRRQLIDLPLTINPTGCARTEPKMRTHFRKPHITLQSSSSHHSLPTSVTGLSGDLTSPYMKHFVHSKSQQYRRLKTEWKNLVYLGRSRIQGLGLFAARDLDPHTMVIEYIGELIRNETANRREKIYEETNRGVYMFRIDDNTVVDATMSGGPARYINHSCDPNCQAEVVELDKGSKIIIITNRRISKGEELTYDYQFDFEDDQHKIPCMCGAHCCRKWMN